MTRTIVLISDSVAALSRAQIKCFTSHSSCAIAMSTPGARRCLIPLYTWTNCHHWEQLWQTWDPPPGHLAPVEAPHVHSRPPLKVTNRFFTFIFPNILSSRLTTGHRFRRKCREKAHVGPSSDSGVTILLWWKEQGRTWNPTGLQSPVMPDF